MSHALANVAVYRSDDAARVVVAVTLDVDRVDLAHEVVCRFAPTGAERKFSFAGKSGRAEFPHPEATTVTVDIDQHTPVAVAVPDEFGEDNAVTVHDAVRIGVPPLVEEEPEEEPEEADSNDEVPEKAADVIAWIGDDEDRARAALEAEEQLSPDDRRSTVLDKIESVLDDGAEADAENGEGEEE